jgi:two-component system, OmpR family, response regulator
MSQRARRDEAVTEVVTEAATGAATDGEAATGAAAEAATGAAAEAATGAATDGEAARAPGQRRGLVAVAEHEPEVAEMIRQYLSRAGLSSWLTASPAEAVATLRAREAVVYVLDLTMPGLDLSLVRRTLGSGAAARAVFLVGSRGVRPRGLGAGPGERRWLTRPFSPRALAEMVCELAVPAAGLVRAAALVRAAGPVPAAGLVRAAGPVPAAGLGPDADGRAADGRAAANNPPECGLNTASRTVMVSGREVSLTRSEFALLAALTEAAGRVLTRDQLLQRLAAERGKVPGPRAIDVYITQLRAKLGDGAIRTVRGAGYAVDRPA